MPYITDEFWDLLNQMADIIVSGEAIEKPKRPSDKKKKLGFPVLRAKKNTKCKLCGDHIIKGSDVISPMNGVWNHFECVMRYLGKDANDYEFEVKED